MKNQTLQQLLAENLSLAERQHLLAQLQSGLRTDSEYNTIGFSPKRSFWAWLFRRPARKVTVYSVLGVFGVVLLSVKRLEELLLVLQKKNRISTSMN
jgi:hypothetical protein